MKNNIKTIVLVGVLAIVGIVFFSTYNGLVTKEEKVEGTWSQVQNQYKRRADLVPALVKVAKSYAEQERATLTAVIEARSAATAIKLDPTNMTAEDLKKFQQAQGELSQALGKLMAISESYPDLKSNQNYLDLQAQLEGTENRISVARKNFIDATQDYNTAIRRIPTNIIASLFGFDKRPYFEEAESSANMPEIDL
ncbi:MAG: LemA family protein [Bacteroidaceae bacterium]|nr:LemA family protein [Bacteroidaceae bacterium]